MRPLILGHDFLTKVGESAAILKRFHEREQVNLQKQATQLSSIKTAEIAEGVRHPSSSSPVLDLAPLINEKERVDVTRRVLTMQHDTYLEVLSLLIDSDNDEETSVEVSSYKEFAKAEASSRRVEEKLVCDVVGPNKDPEEPINAPAQIDLVAPSFA
uniref:Uncharacterized protein n=1 Tax=Cannabis sativa TaxID=3483 RepID=A0A803NL35_CANSA